MTDPRVEISNVYFYTYDRELSRIFTLVHNRILGKNKIIIFMIMTNIIILYTMCMIPGMIQFYTAV